MSYKQYCFLHTYTFVHDTGILINHGVILNCTTIFLNMQLDIYSNFNYPIFIRHHYYSIINVFILLHLCVFLIARVDLMLVHITLKKGIWMPENCVVVICAKSLLKSHRLSYRLLSYIYIYIYIYAHILRCQKWVFRIWNCCLKLSFI